MKQSRNWLKDNFYTIVVLLLLPILVMVSIMFWFYTDAYLRWNPDNFNNISTPIAAIVSGVLLFFALMQTNKQNKLALSQAVKAIYQERYDNVCERMKSDRTELIRAIADTHKTNVHLNDLKLNSINYIDYVRFALERIKSNPDYKSDLERYYAKLPALESIHRRSYYLDLEFVYSFAEYPVLSHDSVYDFLLELKTSNLLPLEISNFKQRIRRNLLDRYFANLDRKMDVMVPVLYTSGQPWINYDDSGIRKYYDFFKQELD